MKILLIDVDSLIPNLALIQISAYHKLKGDQIKLINYSIKTRKQRSMSLDIFGFDADRAYISCIFTMNKEVAPGHRREIGCKGRSNRGLRSQLRMAPGNYAVY